MGFAGDECAGMDIFCEARKPEGVRRDDPEGILFPGPLEGAAERFPPPWAGGGESGAAGARS